MTDIERLRQMPIVGNHYSDSGLFNLAHQIIMSDDEPMENKLEAIRKIDEAQGEEGDVSEANVNEYMNFVKESN